jgi:hypothetical protein
MCCESCGLVAITPVSQVPVFSLTPQCHRSLDTQAFKICAALFEDAQEPFEVKLGAQIMSILFTQGSIDIGRLFSQTPKFQHHQRQVAHRPSYPTSTLSQMTPSLQNQPSINFLPQNHLLSFHNAKCIILFSMISFFQVFFLHSYHEVLFIARSAM